MSVKITLCMKEINIHIYTYFITDMLTIVSYKIVVCFSSNI